MALGRKFNQKIENQEGGTFQSSAEQGVEKSFEAGKQTYEQSVQDKERRVGQETSTKPVKNPARKKSAKTKPAPVAVSDQEVYEIKSVLGEDLGPSYYKMTPEEQRQFLSEEEKVAVEIDEELHKPRVKAKKIFKLIFNWIKGIPLVNSFFAKQEAKIKTEKIIELKQKK